MLSPYRASIIVLLCIRLLEFYLACVGRLLSKAIMYLYQYQWHVEPIFGVGSDRCAWPSFVTAASAKGRGVVPDASYSYSWLEKRTVSLTNNAEYER